eukprot:3141635-Rhodomonas_salina.1
MSEATFNLRMHCQVLTYDLCPIALRTPYADSGSEIRTLPTSKRETMSDSPACMRCPTLRSALPLPACVCLSLSTAVSPLQRRQLPSGQPPQQPARYPCSQSRWASAKIDVQD